MKFFFCDRKKHAIICLKQRGTYVKKPTYEDLLRYNVMEAIDLKCRTSFNYYGMTFDERQEFEKTYPLFIENHPLLLDYDWVYENVEFLFMFPSAFKEKQSVEAYYVFFKAITSKYDVYEDDRMLFFGLTEEASWIERKWASFAEQLIDFFTYSLDPSKLLDYLFTKEHFVDYFMRYSTIYTPKIVKRFVEANHPGLLQNGYYRNYFCSHPELMIKCIDNVASLKPPIDVLLDSTFIANFVKNPDISDFYYQLNKLTRFVGEQSFLDEYKKFCEKEMAGIKDGIVPSLEDSLQKSQDFFVENDLIWDSPHAQIIGHIQRRYNLDKVPKRLYFEELSRYRLIGMIISCLFEAEPYELMIDVETLYDFAKRHNRQLKGQEIYEYLLDYDAHSVKDLLAFYDSIKLLPLKDILYDDWTKQKETMIEEINDTLMALPSLPIERNADGVEYRDITILSGTILETNTFVDVTDFNNLQKLVDDIVTGNRNVEWLSLQDEEHQVICRDLEPYASTCIKLIFGPLDPRKVGIVNHEDAYSWRLTIIDPRNLHIFKRRLYTADELLENTWRYNEITHDASVEPFLPIGVLVEEEITEGEIWLANKLGIPIYFRKKRIDKVQKQGNMQQVLLPKRYGLKPSSKRFF